MKRMKQICGLNGNECLQHTGLQCSGESINCYWKQIEQDILEDSIVDYTDNFYGTGGD